MEIWKINLFTKTFKKSLNFVYIQAFDFTRLFSQKFSKFQLWFAWHTGAKNNFLSINPSKINEIFVFVNPKYWNPRIFNYFWRENSNISFILLLKKTAYFRVKIQISELASCKQNWILVPKTGFLPQCVKL